MSPARVVIERFGGVPTVADLLGINRSQVYRWDMSKEVGGQEGIIPAKYLRPLLLASRAMEIPLTAEELILGAGEEAADAAHSPRRETVSRAPRPPALDGPAASASPPLDSSP